MLPVWGSGKLPGFPTGTVAMVMLAEAALAPASEIYEAASNIKARLECLLNFMSIFSRNSLDVGITPSAQTPPAEHPPWPDVQQYAFEYSSQGKSRNELEMVILRV